MAPTRDFRLFHTDRWLVLASASPRRRDFLEGLGLVFEVATADIDETPAGGEAASAFVRRLAEEKARVVAAKQRTAWVLAADTVVVLDNTILGKPENPEAALAMLKKLSGRWHAVWTGFCLHHAETGRLVAKSVRTEVRFARFAEEICRAYVRTGEPLDKAGAYGIQGRGGFLVEEIKGSYSNVVGLPLTEVTAELLRLGIIRPTLA